MSILIDDQKFIGLKFHFLEIKEKFATKFKFIQTPEDFEKNKDDPNLKELNTGWKLLSWSEHNTIYSECLDYKTGETGAAVGNIDFIKFRDMKLKTCLKTWDFKDETGRPVPLTAAVIDKLHPDVANELINGFERVTEMTPDERKNF